jgi:hypothetical protein
MTSDSAPSPLVTSASTVFSGSFPAWQAWDGQYGTDWFANTSTGWNKIDLGSALAIIGYSLLRPTVVGANAAPNSWTFEGSNNDSDWTTLDTQSSVTSWSVGSPKLYTFTESSYRYYRINVSANNGDSLLGIGEVQLIIDAPAGGGASLPLGPSRIIRT